MFEAKMDPDIYFFGFDLTATEVRGGDTVDKDPGWFFVIKERPGEPRYGLDEEDGGAPPKLYNWNNLSWKNTATAPGACLQINQTFSLLPGLPGPNDETANHPEDKAATWRDDYSLNIWQIEALRSKGIQSFGSCSFQEPVSELQALGVL